VSEAGDDDLDAAVDREDLERLQTILLAREDGADGLLVDAIQGMLVALAIGPERVPPESWMPLIVDDGRAFDTEEAAASAVRLILRLHRTVVDAIESDEFHPILTEIESDGGDEDGTRLSARGWCEGFSLGVDLAAEAWEARMGSDPHLLELLGPVISLAADEDLFEPPEGGPLPPLSERDYEVALQELPAAVVAVHSYWQEHPPGVPLSTPSSGPHPVPRRRGGRSVH
jgi:uncharacterized protein